MNPTETAELMAAVCDTLLPGDELFPKASVTGANGLVAARLRDRYGSAIFATLAADLAVEGRTFVSLEEGERVEALQQLDLAKRDFFTFLILTAYTAYYAAPAVIEAVRLDGHIYNDAPQPLGYELTPFGFTPGLDVPLNPKGSFKWTDEMTPIDISSLAELELPVGRERA